jgi:MFS superfamily sulfate permease-like transporter
MTLLNLPFWEQIKAMQDHPAYFDTKMYWLTVSMLVVLSILVGMILGMIISAIYSAIDQRTASTVLSMGTIIDKKYVGETNTSGTGTAIIPNSSGGVGVGIVSTSQHQDEQWLVFVNDGREICKIESNMQQFYSLEVGAKVTIENKIGGLTHKNINRRIV